MATLSKRASLKLYKRTLTANSQVELSVPGSLFCVKESSGVFQVAFDDADFSDVEVGIQFREGDDFTPFKRVFLKNPTGADITCEVWIGTGRNVVDARLNTLVDRTINVSVTSQADSYTKGAGLPTLLSGASATFNGLDGANKRKQIVLRNLGTSAGTLQIKDGAGTIMALLDPGDPPWTMESNGSYTITASGGNCNYSAGETFYS